MPIRPFGYYHWTENIYQSPQDKAVFRCERIVRAKLPDVFMPFEEWAAFIDQCWDTTLRLWPEWQERLDGNRKPYTPQIWIEQYVAPAERTETPEWAAMCGHPNIVIAGLFPLAKSWAIHEIAHAAVDQTIFRYTKPHGVEWRNFYLTMLDEMYPEFGALLRTEFDADPEVNEIPMVMKAGVERLQPMEFVSDVE